MDALQGQHSISPPLVVAANMSATTGGVASSSASTSSAEEVGGTRTSRMRPRDSLLDLLREQGERDEQREREAVARGAERERAASIRAERYLALFEKLIDKI